MGKGAKHLGQRNVQYRSAAGAGAFLSPVPSRTLKSGMSVAPAERWRLKISFSLDIQHLGIALCILRPFQDHESLGKEARQTSRGGDLTGKACWCQKMLIASLCKTHGLAPFAHRRQSPRETEIVEEVSDESVRWSIHVVKRDKAVMAVCWFEIDNKRRRVCLRGRSLPGCIEEEMNAQSAIQDSQLIAIQRVMVNTFCAGMMSQDSWAAQAEVGERWAEARSHSTICTMTTTFPV
ncbi:hypothetical protein CORC01_03630 [Colletotrichum orchidophilum]|uniref:Uncharacterized protein n=1 Tax=Colletotrichum orchidophilum TaxID=1209926 RepID=A0A1G4BIE4_9PEZI|nr:uncharacterized protein CORC01_03630 [Colletotrichum orchidophilum]OHF01063.1 hypothetical protein CORC01_03630 [Colletotrichum orchidophilum]